MITNNNGGLSQKIYYLLDIISPIFLLLSLIILYFIPVASLILLLISLILSARAYRRSKSGYGRFERMNLTVFIVAVIAVFLVFFWKLFAEDGWIIFGILLYGFY